MSAIPPQRRSNVPAELSSFVGRRRELDALRAALGEHRLVTLFGPGGVGKTRLALHAAAGLRDGYADGAWVVELAAVHDPTLVADTAVAALELREGQGTPADRLVAHLADRELLLVLDNCEHVEEAAAELVGRLLAGCPRLHVVVTSRHDLALEGEHLLSVPPLAVPAADRAFGSPEGLLHYDAVRLFVERATASWSGFRVTESNQQAVAELVRRLDGVPLAIELASARVRSLSVEQMLERLTDRFALLSSGNRAALPRQRTLRALIDWSHDLLEPEEQLAWSRASVFSGGFEPAALVAVAADEDLPAERVPAVADSLVARSVFIREPATGRLRMLESVREYGRTRLGEDEERFTRRHLDHYLDVTTRAAREMYGPAGVAWFHRLRADHDNLRSALEECVRSDDAAADGVRMMASLLHYWVMVGRFSEGRRWLERLLASASVPSVPRAAGLVVAGRLAVLQGDADVGRPLLEQALGRATAVGSTTWRAHALHGLALSAIFWGDPARAVAMLEEASALHRIGSDPFGVPLALVQLATVHATLGDSDEAARCAEECIAMSEEASEQWCAGLARWTLALVAWRREQRRAARDHARRALELKQPFGDRLGMAMAMEVVAWSAAADRRHDEAAKLLGAVETAMSSIGGALFRHLLADHATCVEKTTAALGPDAFDRSWREGAALPFDEAVALALGRVRGARSGSGRGSGRGSGPGSGPGRGRAGGGRLTATETEVARLVAEGLTSREIAERLVMSRRTAEGHVGRILAKLGLGSRKEVAPWVAEHLTTPRAPVEP